MKVIGTLLAIAVLVGIVAGIGYGVVTGYEFLSVKWLSLSDDWKAILIVTTAILLFCTLTASLSIRSTIRNYGLKGAGKVVAYNDFTDWYSSLKGGDPDATPAEKMRQLTNQMTLWGGRQVARQTSMLYELLQQNDVDMDQVLKKAEHVYVEIRRELGLRGQSGAYPVV